jgi:hypothetical protein
MKSVSPRIRFNPALEKASRIPLPAMLADPPSPGEDGTPALATVQPDPIVP